MAECTAPDGNRFWIGASHVTNAEWLRVTGNKRDGADDEPVVAMSMTDVSKFIAELNRRFAAHLPRGTRFRLPSTNELVVASTAGGANAADASALGVAGPSVADKRALAAEKGVKWESVMAKIPCRVRTKNPNVWGVYDIVGQGRTICRETEGLDESGRPKHVQLGPDDIAERSLVGEWGWNSTLRLALGDE
jgi:formylglycine-generating enzyme required for sulfatase activity